MKDGTAATPLSDLPPYVYGTTRLGDDTVPREQRLAMARAVLDEGLWIHASDQYGGAIGVLGEAIAERPDALSMIVNIGGGTTDEAGR